MDRLSEIQRQLKIAELVEYLKHLERERLKTVQQIRTLNNGR